MVSSALLQLMLRRTQLTSPPPSVVTLSVAFILLFVILSLLFRDAAEDLSLCCLHCRHFHVTISYSKVGGGGWINFTLASLPGYLEYREEKLEAWEAKLRDHMSHDWSIYSCDVTCMTFRVYCK